MNEREEEYKKEKSTLEATVKELQNDASKHKNLVDMKDSQIKRERAEASKA